MSHFHTVVWIDHREAHVIGFSADQAESAILHAQHGHRQVHHRQGSISGGRITEDRDFLRRVSDAVRPAGEILITGPAAAKLHLYDWWKAHEPAIAAKVAGIETSDHPTDGQILKHARAYFEAADRMRPQR